ncbi:hypothetical protein HZ326_31734 [Fusarium oxysporum f. sp. albedinis]|nr:hypothetical protein HZ326_31734 [Fusarium oxysporum f. sp. albedinis]
MRLHSTWIGQMRLHSTWIGQMRLHWTWIGQMPCGRSLFVGVPTTHVANAPSFLILTHQTVPAIQLTHG